jgi:hypothetical protein
LNPRKERKAIPNPNRRFVTLAEVPVASETISVPMQAAEDMDAVEDVIEVGGMEEYERSNSEAEELPTIRTSW